MAKNQSTYTLKIDAELGNLQKTLNDAKTSLASFMASGNAPKGLEKAFEKINDLLGQISDKAGKPLDLKGLTGAGKDLSTIQENFRAIVRLLGEFDDLSEDVKLSFVSPEEQKKVKDITSALEAYGKAADETAKKIKSLDAAKKTQAKEESALSKAKKKVGDLENDQIRTRGKLTGAQGKLDAARLDGSSAKDIAKYEAEVVKLRAELEILDKNLGSANEELTKAQSVYDASAKSVKDLESEIKRMGGSSLKELKEEAKALGVSFEGLNGHDAAKQVEILSARMLELKKQIISGAKPAFDKFQEECKQGERAAEGLEKEMQGAIKSVEQMNEAASERENFENKIKQFLGLSGAAHVMRAALRDAMSTITELDAVMGQMAVVTDLTVGDYWDQLPEYSERASNLGVSITEAYEAATLYYQQGLKANEVTALSEQTLKMAAIAGLDAADATDRMTAALRGFNMELNEANAQKIADVYSELAAITASDVDEISTAMTKTASIAASAGMEFETTAAFLSQIIETTRESAETAGTAMKTVVARFQELKKDPSEIGEVDGEIVDANAIETALRSVGVSLRDARGQFRELDDVFLELSKKWNTLDKNTQRYIATIAAGSRQQSRFIAMMQDYSRTQELVTAANNSAGASQKQFEKTMDTLAYKVERLKNAWHEFTMGIMDSDLVKAGVDILTKFLEVVNKITSSFDGFLGSITKIGGILAVFKIGSAMFEKLKQPLIGFFAEVVQASQQAGKDATQAFVDESKKTAQQSQKTSVSGMGVGVLNATGVTDFDNVVQAGARKKRLRGYMTLSQEDRETKIASNKKDLASLQKRRSELTDEKEIAKYNQAIEETEQNITDLSNTEEEFTKASKQQWESMSKGLAKAGQAAAGVGLAFGMVGQAFTDAGLEEAGEVITGIGSAFMILSTIMQITSSILPLMQAGFAGAGAAGVASGSASTAAWSVVGVIVMAVLAGIMLTVALILVVLASIKKASPEAKLKKLQEATEAVEEAADQAAEKYENLKNSLDELKESQKSLENLRKGTEEWTKAVEELNASVMDLITQYPELASLMQRDGAVLSLDVNSASVKDVMQQYKTVAAQMQGVALGSNIRVAEAEQDVAYSQLGKKAAGNQGTEDFYETGKWVARIAPLLFTGGVVEFGVAALASKGFQDAQESLEEKNRKATDLVAEALAKGEISGTYSEIKDLLDKSNLNVNVDKLAQELSQNTEALKEYGYSAKSTDAKEQANLEAMLSTILGSLDPGAYSEEALNWIYTMLSTEDLERSKEQHEKDFGKLSNKEQKNVLENYAYDYLNAESVKVKNNKVKYTDKQGNEHELSRENFEDDYFNMLALASGSDAAKELPSSVATIQNLLGGEMGEAFAKAMSQKEGGALTKANSDILKQLSDEQKKQMWDSLSESQQEFFGSYESFIGKIDTAIKGADDAMKGAVESAEKLGATLNKNFDADASAGWSKLLGLMAQDGDNVVGVNNALNSMLEGLAEEEIKAVMSQINAIDITDIDAWENLANVFEKLNIKIDDDKLSAFVDEAIAVSDSIHKIDFGTFNDELNETYTLINKIKSNGARKFGEEDYNKLTGANSELTKDFVKLGDDYLYVGSSMDALIDALEENTYALIDEAKEQLDAKVAIARIVSEKSVSTDMAGAFDREQALNYLMEVRDSAEDAGWNLSALGVSGLANNVEFTKLDSDKLTEYAKAVAKLYGQEGTLEDDRKKVGREADIQKYVAYNKASENAYLGQGEGEEAQKYREALIRQAIESGGVNNSLITSYQAAIENADWDEVEKIGTVIADSTERILEEQAGRDEYLDLIDRVTEAIEEQRQDEIDHLSEINNTINTANEQLVSKIQQQIDEDRQARQNAETEKDIQDLYSQRAALFSASASPEEILAIEKQIADAERDYQDTLIDQSIQRLQDANEHAAEQRERQIALLEQQLQADLDSGTIANEAANIVRESVEALQKGTTLNDTTMGSLLKNSETEGMNELQESAWGSAIGAAATMAANWLATQGIERKAPENEYSGNYTSTGGDASGRDNDALIQINSAISEGRSALTSNNDSGGWSHRGGNAAYQSALQKYLDNGGQSEGDFQHAIFKEISDDQISGTFPTGSKVKGLDPRGNYDMRNGGRPYDDVKVWIDDVKHKNLAIDMQTTIPGETQKAISELSGDGKTPEYGWLAMYLGVPYIYTSGGWRQFNKNYSGYDGLKQSMIKALTGKQFKTGGLADFTGPAWLDGTPSKPEYILNAAQTERFFSLVNVLESLDSKEGGGKSSGDNYFDIEINVEKLENDYDLEQVANKIRSMIYEDATYRNVNAINNIR